jgi:hypothetical protein
MLDYVIAVQRDEDTGNDPLTLIRVVNGSAGGRTRDVAGNEVEDVPGAIGVPDEL